MTDMRAHLLSVDFRQTNEATRLVYWLGLPNHNHASHFEPDG